MVARTLLIAPLNVIACRAILLSFQLCLDLPNLPLLWQKMSVFILSPMFAARLTYILYDHHNYCHVVQLLLAYSYFVLKDTV